MLNGLEGALNLVKQAVQHIITEDPITSVWFALVIIMVIAVFLISKLLNRDG